MRVVVDRMGLDDCLELGRGLGELAVAKVGTPKRLANRALLRLAARGLGERLGRSLEASVFEQLDSPAVEQVGRLVVSGALGGLRVHAQIVETVASAALGEAPLSAVSEPGSSEAQADWRWRSRRIASTRTRIASAISSLGAIGTASSPPAVTSVTALRSESKPMRASETSFKTIMSAPLRSNLARAESTPFCSVSAANPTTVCQSGRGSSEARMSVVGSRSSARSPVRRSFSAATSRGVKS